MARSSRFDILSLSRTIVVGVLLALGLTSVGTWLPSSAPSTSVSAEVVRVIDGDTIVVQLDDEQVTVRYLGIDAPEMDWNMGHHEMFAVEATETNRSLVDGRIVELEFDIVEEDPYGRGLAHVFADGVHVNRYLVAEGLAQLFFIEPNALYWDEFLQAQREAQAMGRGYWGALGEPVQAAEAGSHLGMFRTVEGTVTSAVQNPEGDITFVSVSGGLTLRIYPEGRVLFEEPPEAVLADRRIQVTGMISGNASRPYMVVRDPEWIVVLE